MIIGLLLFFAGEARADWRSMAGYGGNVQIERFSRHDSSFTLVLAPLSDVGSSTTNAKVLRNCQLLTVLGSLDESRWKDSKGKGPHPTIESHAKALQALADAFRSEKRIIEFGFMGADALRGVGRANPELSCVVESTGLLHFLAETEDGWMVGKRPWNRVISVGVNSRGDR